MRSFYRVDKLGRNYKLFIQTMDPTLHSTRSTPSASPEFTMNPEIKDDVLYIAPPFTLEFDIQRNFLGSQANLARFRIYNLAPLSRNAIRFDDDNYGEFRSVTLQAGYGNNLSTIFKGNITRGSSRREGVNFITEIICGDAGYNYTNSFFSQVVPSNVTDRTLFETLIESMPGVSVGAVGDFPNTSLRSSSYNAPTIDILYENSNGCFFIDKQKAHVLNPDEYISNGDILVVSSETGLLGTPQISDTILYFDMIFEPRIDVGSLILLQSETDKKYNKYWRITEVTHRGMVSESVCGEVITTVNANYTPNPKPVISR